MRLKAWWVNRYEPRRRLWVYDNDDKLIACYVLPKQITKAEAVCKYLKERHSCSYVSLQEHGWASNLAGYASI